MRALQFWRLASQRANISIGAHLARAPFLLHDMTECNGKTQQACEFRCFSSCVIVARAFSIPFYLPNALPPGISNMQLEGPGFQHKCSPFYPPNHSTHSGAPLSNINLKASLFLFSLAICSLCPQTIFTHIFYQSLLVK